MPHLVIRDTREQEGWYFAPSENCAGTAVATLRTGDYTLEKFETVLCIERKGSTAEFARNINEGRFEKELVRMEQFLFPFMILEFTMEDIIRFPEGSGIPKEKWPEVRVSNFFMLKRFIEFQLKYKTKIILAGKHGLDTARSIFKRVIEYGEQSSTQRKGTSRRNNRTGVARN